MALVKAKDLRQHSAEELTQKTVSLRKELFELTQKREVGQLDRPHRMRQIRREIAQIQTVKNEKRS
jgi:large subunit ribosomal protein L29